MAQVDSFQQYLMKKYPNMSKTQFNELNEFTSKQREQEANVESVKSGKIALSDIPIDQRGVIASQLPTDFEITSKKQKEKQTLINEAQQNAEAVKKVLELGKNGQLQGREFQDALNYAASKYNASAAFSEGGKTLTGSELGILAGSLIKFEQPRKQNWLESITGKVPSPTGNLEDDPDTIYRKMILATKGIEGLPGMQSSQPQSQQIQTTPADTQYSGSPKDQRFEGNFINNIIQDVKQNVEGITAIPGVIGDIVTGKVKGGDVASTVAKGVYDEYAGLVPLSSQDGQIKFDPEKTASAFYEKPVSSFLDVLPFLQAGKVAFAGKTSKTLSTAGKVAEGAKTLETAAGATDDVARILNKTKVAGEAKTISPLARNVYQSVLSISKKNNAFERLKPTNTVEDMIKYGIGGNSDEIAMKAQKVTGSNGIVSNVVNSAIAETQGVIKTDKVAEFLSDSKKGRFSSLNSDKIDELAIRIGKLPQGDNMFDLEITKAFDLERQLQEEAVKHLIDGSKGDTAAKELGTLKMELADQIGTQIDDVVKNAGNLNKYKDPRIMEELKTVSPKLAQDYWNAKTIKDLRSLQKPFVRISKIIELANSEASSLGSKFFNIPGIGPILRTAAESVVQPIATKGAIAGDRLSPILGTASKAARNPGTLLLERQINEQRQNPQNLLKMLGL